MLVKQLSERITQYSEANLIPGYVAGVYHDGQEGCVAYGLANAATQAPMREDTGFLFGSITKLLTTTLVLQQVERGRITLDDLVRTYVPGFRVSTANQIKVRHLLTHTNGIDADLFFPDANGRDALKTFVEQVGQKCGVLFEPGAYVSYSNGGMLVAGRLLEAITGADYHTLLERELFAPAGMRDSCTSAEQAILRGTAVGHFFDPQVGSARPTDMFKLPDSWASAGSSPIGSVHDLLAFARTHLNHGVAPTGNQILSREWVERMQSPTHDMRTPNVPPIGLGWLLMPFGKTTVLAHSGASPGGVALLAVVPEHDFAFAAFGNDARAMALHDQLLLWLLEEDLGVAVPDLLCATCPPADLAQYAGTFHSNQLRVDVAAIDGQLEERVTYEPMDEVQERIFNRFCGGAFPFPPRRFVQVGKDLFAPASVPLGAFNGYMRQQLVSYHAISAGHAMYRCAGGRMSKRV